VLQNGLRQDLTSKLFSTRGVRWGSWSSTERMKAPLNSQVELHSPIESQVSIPAPENVSGGCGANRHCLSISPVLAHHRKPYCNFSWIRLEVGTHRSLLPVKEKNDVSKSLAHITLSPDIGQQDLRIPALRPPGIRILWNTRTRRGTMGKRAFQCAPDEQRKQILSMNVYSAFSRFISQFPQHEGASYLAPTKLKYYNYSCPTSFSIPRKSGKNSGKRKRHGHISFSSRRPSN
jgi:hypothetical protein